MDSKNWLFVKEAFGRWMDLPGGERPAFIESLAESVRAEVERLAENYEMAENFIESPAMLEFAGNLVEGDAPDPYIGTTIDDYLILSRIGVGGMGAVYLAEHSVERLKRHVAVKLIKRGMDTSSVLKRFYRERQILAGLEHPNIARLLDGGSTEAGLPYFVMEYVEGRSIQKYCPENRLYVRERLRLFRTVCSAVSYAHANLIVHRDLKPSNILVDGRGEVKLLDFGIAKLLNPDWQGDSEDVTGTMFRALTPEYASPEQLRGEAVTTASDVYSLGVVLYELLAGVRPFEVDAHSPVEIALRIATTDPPAPSAAAASTGANNWGTNPNDMSSEMRDQDGDSAELMRRSLRGDLDNIILKALEKDANRRYASVQEFSEDLRRFLEGEPVSASSPTLAYRANKFIRRNFAATASAAAVLLVLIAATGITAWQARQAMLERQTADRRFQQVRQLATAVVFDYHDAIAKLSGSTAVRARMLTDTLGYLDAMAAERSSDIELMREVAAAYEKIGGVQGGDESLGILGQSEASMESYRKAVAIREAIVAASTGDISDSFALAVAYRQLGDGLGVKGDFPGRLSTYEKAVQLHDAAVQAQPGRADFVDGLANAHYDLGYAYDQSGENAGAEAAFTRAISLWGTIPERTATSLLSRTHKFLGRLRDKEGRTAEARSNFEEALRLDLARAEADPLDMQVRLDLSAAYATLANSLVGTKEFLAAEEACQKALEIRRKLVEEDPANVRAKAFLARGLDTLGQVQMGLRNAAAAMKSFEEAINIFSAPGMDDPADLTSQNLMANFHKSLGDAGAELAEAVGRSSQRRKLLQQAKQNYERAAEISLMLRSRGAMTAQNKADPDQLKQRVDVIIAKLQLN